MYWRRDGCKIRILEYYLERHSAPSMAGFGHLHEGVKPMRKITKLIFAVLPIVVAASMPAAAGSCSKKYSMGQAPTEDIAKFEVDAALLQSTDMGIYATWVVGAGTPGYSFGPRAYRCKQDSVLWTCHGSATLCKL